MVTMETIFTALLLLLSKTVSSHACPAMCHCPSSDNQVNCIKANLTTIPRDIPQATSTLDLSNNFLETVSSLSWLRNVVTLKFENNVIQSVQEGAFQTLVGLQVLDLSQNRLSIISDKALVGIDQLMLLDLSHNLLQHVDGAFVGKKELNRLDLSHNQIHRITQFTFRDLEQLRYLVVSDNLISHIDKRAFKNLEKLMYLVLKGNPLHRVTKFEFTSQVLSYVDLSECGLNQIPRGLPSTIRYLQLRRNNLSEIHRRSFRDCPHTSILVLDENGITSIDDRAFEDMEYLSQLWLNGNKLTHVPHPLPDSLKRLLMDQNRILQLTNVFPANSQIETLSFMGNNISYVAFDTFSKLNSLLSLDLSNNRINHLYGHTFINQTKLKTLQISKNPLTHLHSRCLWGLSSLTTLSLAYIDTDISIHPDVFLHLTQLDKLDINSSPWLVRTLLSNEVFMQQLSSVSDLSMQSCELTHLQPYFPIMFHNLNTLHISSTRWHCDKNMIWFRDWLKNTAIDVINKPEITCFTPRMVHGRSVTSLSDSEFVEVTTPLHTTTTTTRVLSTFPSTTTSTTMKTKSTTSQIPPTGVTADSTRHIDITNSGSSTRYNDKDHSVEDNGDKDFDPNTSFEFLDPFSDNTDSNERRHQTWEEYLNGQIEPVSKQSTKIPSEKYASDEQDNHPVLSQTTFDPYLEAKPPDTETSNMTTIIIIVVTIATIIIAAIIITLIVYLTRKQHRNKEKDGTEYRNGIKYNHKNDVLYFMPNGSVKKEGSTTDSIKTNSTSKEQMTLIPGRDINHEGPLRVYKWEDF